MANIRYRKDIDGLRAFAVIPVMLFHGGVELFSGGYVGVDVFFVISGYLITSIMIGEMEAGSFSIRRFLMRRIRRLLPMALVVYISILLLFSFIYPTVYYEKLSAGVLSSMAFVSNIFFWKQGGYFSSGLELNPALHTWSLSVEEQFYLTFPFFLLLLNKIFKSDLLRYMSLLGLIALSLAVAIAFTPSYQSVAGFYLLPPRLYELAIGAFLAMLFFKKPDLYIRKVPFMKELGLFLIFLAIFNFDEDTEFPSYNALLPVLGGALVIVSSRHGGVVDYLLTHKIIVFVGLISYSLYLWHWPVIVYMNWVFGETQNLLHLVVYFLISGFLAAITYRYVEQPFRDKVEMPNLKVLKITGVGSVVVLIASSIGLAYGNYTLVDPTGSITRQYNSAVQAEPYRSSCTDKARRDGQFSYCELPGYPTNRDTAKVYVWGDSHGSAFIPALEPFSKDYQIRFTNTSGCPPVVGVRRTDWPQACERVNGQVMHHILEENYDLVILVAAYNNYLNWGIIGDRESDYIRDPNQAATVFSELMNSTLNSLHSAEVPFILISQPPRFEERIPDTFLRSATLGLDYNGGRILMETYSEQLNTFLTTLNSRWKGNVVTFIDTYCPGGLCVGTIGNNILYKDQHHISNYHAQLISESLHEVLANAINSAD